MLTAVVARGAPARKEPWGVGCLAGRSSVATPSPPTSGSVRTTSLGGNRTIRNDEEIPDLGGVRCFSHVGGLGVVDVCCIFVGDP